MNARTMTISLVLIFSALCRPTQAHRPIFSQKSATDPNTAVLIAQPHVSQVVYREITEQAKQVWLAFDAKAGFELFIQIGVPVLERLKDFRPAMLVVGPGLPEGDFPIELPNSAGAVGFPTDGVEEPRFFHEHFTGTDSWILRTETAVLPKSGRYYLVAYVPSGRRGKLWLSIGKKESFGLAEWAKFGEWKKRIREFHEINQKGRKLRIPILSQIGDMLGLGSTRPGDKISDSNDEVSVEIREGIRIHTVETEYQNGKQEIHVILPEDYRSSKKYRVLYVLPVEEGFHRRYGYGLGVLKQMDAQNEYDLIVVQMGFEKKPWYGDHASDPKTRQASYLREFVVPFVEKHYSTKETPEGRLLFGFSKSGWGAFSLIMTYPKFFGYAASWDAPMVFDRFHYSMEQVYGTLDQLKVYRPDLLASTHKEHFQMKTRLVLAGQNDWGTSIPTPTGGDHTLEMHKLFDKEEMKHVYDNNLKVPHRWNQQWMAPTLAALMGLTRAEPNSM